MAKILIVDDEPDVLEFQKAFLTRRKHEVVIAGNAREAIEVATKELPEVVFCDVRIDSDRAGFEVLEAIKKIKPDAVVYLITGLIDSDTEEQGLSIGAKEVLTKPLPNDVLEKKINEALSSLKEDFHVRPD